MEMFRMSDSTRPSLHSVIGRGFCRTEVQKIARKHLGRAIDGESRIVSARDILGVFTVLTIAFEADFEFLDRTEESITLKPRISRNGQRISEILVFHLLKYPELVSEMIIALKQGERRLQLANANNPERLIEENFWNLQECLDENKLISQILPPIKIEELNQVSTRMTASRKTVVYWLALVIEEAGFTEEDQPSEEELSRILKPWLEMLNTHKIDP